MRTNVRVGVNVLVQHCLPPLYQPPGVIGLGLPRLWTSAHLWGASACHTGATKQVGQLGGAHHSPIPLELCPYLLRLRAQRHRVRCFRDSAAPLNKRSPRTSPAKTSRRMAQLIRCFSECRYKRSARAECCGVMTILGSQHRVSSHSWRWPRDGLAVCDLEMELHSTCTSEVLPCKPHRALQAMLVWGQSSARRGKQVAGAPALGSMLAARRRVPMWAAVLLVAPALTGLAAAQDWAAAYARDNPMRWLNSLAHLPAQVRALQRFSATAPAHTPRPDRAMAPIGRRSNSASSCWSSAPACSSGSSCPATRSAPRRAAWRSRRTRPLPTCVPTTI